MVYRLAFLVTFLAMKKSNTLRRGKRKDLTGFFFLLQFWGSAGQSNIKGCLVACKYV